MWEKIFECAVYEVYSRDQFVKIVFDDFTKILHGDDLEKIVAEQRKKNERTHT